MVKLPKIVLFFSKFMLTSTRNRNLLKGFYLYPIERPRHVLSLCFIVPLSNISRDIEEENTKKGMTQQKFNKIN